MSNFEAKDWVTFAMSGVALAVSVAGFSLNYAKDRRDRLARLPLVTATIAPIKERPDWHRVTLTLRSRDSHSWRIESVKLKRPFRKTGLMSLDIGLEADPASAPYAPKRRLKTPLPLNKLTRAVAVQLRVRPSGTQPSHILGGTIIAGSGDSSSDDFLLYSPKSSGPRVLKLSVEIIQWDEREHRMTVVVRRQITPTA